jgi:hypothetical protein
MRAFVLAGLFMVAGCSSASDRAEREYQIVVENKGSVAERCRAARAVADAFLKEQNQPRHKEATARANIVCASSEGSSEFAPEKITAQ